MKKIGLIDIANELNTSISTVYRALSETGRVNPDTKARVLETARNMGYSPNYVASALSSKKNARFAIICADNYFYYDIIEGIKSAAKKYTSLNIEFDFLLTKSYSPVEQSEQLEKVISQADCYDAIAIAPAHPISLNPLIKKLTELNIGVITFDNDAPECGRSTFIGPRGYVAGKLCAQLYGSSLSQGSSVAIMSSYVSAIGLQDRVKGFEDGCKSSGKLDLIGTFGFVDQADEAYEFCKHIISTFNPSAIFCNSMLGTIGCAKAIVESHNSGKTFIIGFDYNQFIKEYIEDGTLFASIYQNPFLQGYYVVDHLVSMYVTKQHSLNRESKEILITSGIIMLSNLEEYPLTPREYSQTY